MKKVSVGAGKRATWMVALAVAGVAAAEVGATPFVNSAVINTRIFNDFPSSMLGFTDNYPAIISISDNNTSTPPPPGFANLHNWQFSENNFTSAVFNNGDFFSYSADLTISGTGTAEAGLLVAPWFSQNVDGRLNVRIPNGEVAAFGGRLPFFSFTSSFGIHYAAGDTIGLGITYDPHSLSMADPGTIQYTVDYNGTHYSSPVIPFDEGNTAEDPPYGLWGILNDARVGGHYQAFNGTAGSTTATWTNISFLREPVPEPSSLLLMLLGGALLGRRRR
jgi:hypothetical protein